MPNSVIKNPRRIVSQAGSASDPRVDTLAANEYKVLYWASVATASGTITVPTGATILLDQLQGGVDAYPSTISAGQPTGDFPQTAGSALVTVTSFDVSGNYTLSGTPSAFPVAIVYLLKISALNWGNLTTANILEDSDYNLFLNELQIGTGNFQKSSGISIGADITGGYNGSVIGSYNTRIGTSSGRGYILEDAGVVTGLAAIEVRGYGNPVASRTTYQLITYGTTSTIGNYTGTSLSTVSTVANSYTLGDYASGFTINGTGTKVDLAAVHVSLVGTTGTNYGTRLDATGFRIGQLSTLHSTNSVAFDVDGLRIMPGTTTCLIKQVGGGGATTLQIWNSTNTGVVLNDSGYTDLSQTNGVRVTGRVSIGTGGNPTNWLELAASTTARAHVLFTTGVAPSAPADGMLWFDGYLQTRAGGTSRTIVLAPNATKITAAAPYTNDGYVVMNINGTDFKLMTTA